jgi:hypothetical protein
VSIGYYAENSGFWKVLKPAAKYRGWSVFRAIPVWHSSRLIALYSSSGMLIPNLKFRSKAAELRLPSSKNENRIAEINNRLAR